jgi:transcriptional regulator with XRE-family HTH domain
VADSDALRHLLAGAMRDARLGRALTLAALAGQIGVSKGFLSEAERGLKPPSPRIVSAYDHLLECDGVLVGLHEDHQAAVRLESGAVHGARPRDRDPRPVPGDAVEFLSESPDGLALREGAPEVKTWTVRNTGSVVWEGRQLRRTGRVRGREIPASELSVPVARTAPGETVTFAVTLHCAQVPGTRILRFKLVDADGRLCFPDDDYGVTVEVTSIPSS